MNKSNIGINIGNNSLLEENKKLKEQLSQKEIYINKLKTELEKYKKENKNLKKNYNNIQFNYNELNILRNENNNLKQKLSIKENEINNLKLQKERKFVDFNDIIVVNFISTDQNIRDCSIKCLKTDTFAEIEERLYKIYDKYRETNNLFAVGGKTILRFKTLNENGIKDGDIIQLLEFEE